MLLVLLKRGARGRSGATSHITDRCGPDMVSNTNLNINSLAQVLEATGLVMKPKSVTLATLFTSFWEKLRCSWTERVGSVPVPFEWRATRRHPNPMSEPP